MKISPPKNACWCHLVEHFAPIFCSCVKSSCASVSRALTCLPNSPNNLPKKERHHLLVQPLDYLRVFFHPANHIPFRETATFIHSLYIISSFGKLAPVITPSTLPHSSSSYTPSYTTLDFAAGRRSAFTITHIQVSTYTCVIPCPCYFTVSSFAIPGRVCTTFPVGAFYTP
jgi:hypothetical protein